MTNKKVGDITADDSGVTVRCTDGTQYDGSIVVGADGVHSVVRQYIRTLALQASSKAVIDNIDEEKPFTCEYRTLWCSFPSQYDGDEDHGGPGTGWETHSSDHSLQYLIGHDRSWIFVYERLPSPTRESTRYTEDDAVAFAERWGDLAVGDKLKVKDVFPQRYHAGMANLEEGILKRWSCGRLVLAGDAAHKFTPNAGLGFNNGIQDATALTNELYRVLHALPEERYRDDETEGAKYKNGPSTEALSAAFERYRATRVGLVKDDHGFSAFITRMSSWKTAFHWFFDWWIQPLLPVWLDTWMMKRNAGGRISKGLVLEFVEGDEPFVGSVPWVHPVRSRRTLSGLTK